MFTCNQKNNQQRLTFCQQIKRWQHGFLLLVARLSHNIGELVGFDGNGLYLMGLRGYWAFSRGEKQSIKLAENMVQFQLFHKTSA